MEILDLIIIYSFNLHRAGNPRVSGKTSDNFVERTLWETKLRQLQLKNKFGWTKGVGEGDELI